MMNIKVVILIVFLSVIGYNLLNSTVSPATKQKYLQEKVVMVTGASSGIGEEVAYQLSEYNVKLVLVARTESKLLKVKENLEMRGFNNVHVIVYDFTDYKGAGRVVEEAVRVYGRLDHVISNHGGAPWSPFLFSPKHQDPDFIDMVFRVNFYSHVQLTLAALPHLEATSGHIFFSSSVLGEASLFLTTVYSASKHALNGFVYSLQQNLLVKQSNVTVTLGALGLIMTKELRVLLRDEPIPDMSKGDLVEAGDRIVGTLVSRPRTLTYPRLAVYVMRFMQQFNPYFAEFMVGAYRYDDDPEHIARYERERIELNYQQGF